MTNNSKHQTEEKRERRRVANRMSARKSRYREMILINELKKNVAELKTKNAKIRKDNEELEQSLSSLRKGLIVQGVGSEQKPEPAPSSMSARPDPITSSIVQRMPSSSHPRPAVAGQRPRVGSPLMNERRMRALQKSSEAVCAFSVPYLMRSAYGLDTFLLQDPCHSNLATLRGSQGALVGAPATMVAVNPIVHPVVYDFSTHLM